MNPSNPSATQPLNPTDRNTETCKVGIWQGHITLPSSFLTSLLLALFITFLLVIHWCFDEIATIRERLILREKVIDKFIERAVTATPAPPVKP